VDQFLSLWPAVLEALKGYSRVAWIGFTDSTPISVSNGVLAVAVAEAGKAKGIQNSKHDERLRQAILDVMRVDVSIDVVLAPDRVVPLVAAAPGAPASQGTPAPASPGASPAGMAEPDAPSLDDPDVDETSGVDLLVREFGATQIGEIEA
jgi:hypothetical protein